MKWHSMIISSMIFSNSLIADSKTDNTSNKADAQKAEAQKTAQKEESKPLKISIKIDGIKSNNGSIAVAIYDNEDKWLSDESVASQKKSAAKGKLEFEFTDLKPGKYGISILHDENDNGKLDMSFFPPGPEEGTAISRDAPASFGPPKWKDAIFPLNENTNMDFKIKYP